MATSSGETSLTFLNVITHGENDMRKILNPANVANFTVQQELAEKVREELKKAEAGTASAETVALDELIASGFNKPSDFISPESKTRKDQSTVTVEEFTHIKDVVWSGWSDEVKKLWDHPVKSLPEYKKALKTHFNRETGSIVGRFGRTLERRLKAESEGRTGNEPRTLDVKCIDHLNAVIKACQKAEDAPFDVTKVAKQCETVIKLIGAKSK